MKSIGKRLLLGACIMASIAAPVYANAPPSAQGEGAELSGLPAMLLVGFLVLCGIVITCFCEWLIGLVFNLDHRNTRLILCTNVVSQILMWLAYFLLHNFLDRIWIIVILEVLIYTGEFLFYRWRMRNVSWRKCLLYTVAANTASLLLGLLIL